MQLISVALDIVIYQNKKDSLRSSIWKCYDGKWKMLFHQGTLTNKFMWKGRYAECISLDKTLERIGCK